MSHPVAGATGPPTQAACWNGGRLGKAVSGGNSPEAASSSCTEASSRPLITQPRAPSSSCRPSSTTVFSKLGSCKLGAASNNPGARSPLAIARALTVGRCPPDPPLRHPVVAFGLEAAAARRLATALVVAGTVVGADALRCLLAPPDGAVPGQGVGIHRQVAAAAGVVLRRLGDVHHHSLAAH